MTECPNCGKLNYRSSTVMPDTGEHTGLNKIIIEPAQFTITCAECDAANLQIIIEPVYIYCSQIESN